MQLNIEFAFEILCTVWLTIIEDAHLNYSDEIDEKCKNQCKFNNRSEGCMKCNYPCQFECKDKCNDGNKMGECKKCYSNCKSAIDNSTVTGKINI